MARWFHSVSEEWLEARKGVLSATDVKKLVPAMKRRAKLKDKDELSPEFIGVWAEKHSDVMLDPTSTGAAARGHILEPYAVDDWNSQCSTRFYHWDDIVICNGPVGFSPDAMNVRQPDLDVRVDVKGGALTDAKGGVFPIPTEIMEVKSYLPDHHMRCVLEDDMAHDELIQVAVAFHVLPGLKRATLLYYCPGAPVSMASFEYCREALKDKIAVVESIAKEYQRTCKVLQGTAGKLHAVHTEHEIWKEWNESMQGDFMLSR